MSELFWLLLTQHYEFSMLTELTSSQVCLQQESKESQFVASWKAAKHIEIFVWSCGRGICGTERGLEDAVRKGSLGLHKNRLQDIPTNTGYKARLWQSQRFIIFPLPLQKRCLCISIDSSKDRIMKQTGETKLHTYCKCPLHNPIGLDRHILFSRWLDLMVECHQVSGKQDCGFQLLKTPVYCRCLWMALWEYSWNWYSHALWPSYILCPHEVNNQACLHNSENKGKKRRKSSSSDSTREKVITNTSENGHQSRIFSSSFYYFKCFKQ